MYTDAKQQFDQQHWRNAYEKFEDVVYQGKGADWRHTKKVCLQELPCVCSNVPVDRSLPETGYLQYMAVCIEHLKHRRERTAALDAYQVPQSLNACITPVVVHIGQHLRTEF